MPRRPAGRRQQRPQRPPPLLRHPISGPADPARVLRQHRLEIGHVTPAHGLIPAVTHGPVLPQTSSRRTSHPARRTSACAHPSAPPTRPPTLARTGPPQQNSPNTTTTTQHRPARPNRPGLNRTRQGPPTATPAVPGNAKPANATEQPVRCGVRRPRPADATRQNGGSVRPAPSRGPITQRREACHLQHRVPIRRLRRNPGWRQPHPADQLVLWGSGSAVLPYDGRQAPCWLGPASTAGG